VLIKRDIDSLMKDGLRFREFDGSKITILGGTGLIGLWLLQMLQQLSWNFGYKIEVRVTTRFPRRAHKILNNDLNLNVEIAEVDFVKGPICLEEADFFINGATPSLKKTGLDDDRAVYLSGLNSSLSITQSAAKYGNKPRVVNLSSGIVYGPQKLSEQNKIEVPISHRIESEYGYLNAKIESELILSNAIAIGLVQSISPRLYTFMGPGLAMDEHFAIGNFLRDGLRGDQITLTGNPETTRSYMYPTDLTIWILSSLLNPKNIDTNIGSEIVVSMFDLANTVSDLTSKKGIRIIGQDKIASNYVPSTLQFRTNYDVRQEIPMLDGFDRWIEWLSQS